jgi:hypothetical protein
VIALFSHADTLPTYFLFFFFDKGRHEVPTELSSIFKLSLLETSLFLVVKKYISTLTRYDFYTKFLMLEMLFL